jgi:hypothetical protein
MKRKTEKAKAKEFRTVELEKKISRKNEDIKNLA